MRLINEQQANSIEHGFEKWDRRLGTLWQRFWSMTFAVVALVIFICTLRATIVLPDSLLPLGFIALLFWLARFLWRRNDRLTAIID